MATTGLLSSIHRFAAEHHNSHRTWTPSVHGHVLHAAPQIMCHKGHRALSCPASGISEGICCSNDFHAQQHFACGSSNNSHLTQQQLQQHRGGTGCGATSPGNWALAACSGPASPASLGWNAASAFFSKYRLGEKMGSGSFGTVHRAVHMQTGNSYAVKVLPKSCLARGTQLDAIQREVSTWQQAQNSKFVAKLEGLFEDEEKAYIVQELCTGGTLHEHLDTKGTCSEQEAANIMQGVLDLLVECHKRSICYGDLKPANIMFSGSAHHQQMQVRAIDFGCSRSAHGHALTQTCGSPLYAAPEIALQRYGVGADVWSAGVLLYQILTGRLPFWPKKTIAQVAKLPAYEVLAGARTYEVQFPHSLWADISPTAQELVSRMLDRNPATRITAAEALQHPWMCATLGFMPMPSSDAAASANNVVGFKGVHGSTLHPALVPLSPGKASNSTPGPLSPQKSSPLRSMLSGELPPSVLVADLFRTPAPVMVPAAE